jgi:hypothetical protein
MKTVRILNTLFLLLSIALLPAVAETITAADAKNHVGDQATVCGEVTGEKTAANSRGKPTFINLDSVYPKQVFTILVWGEDSKNVGELPRVGSRVCASGVIQDYKGVPEIVVRSSGQLSH